MINALINSLLTQSPNNINVHFAIKFSQKERTSWSTKDAIPMISKVNV